MKHPLMTTLPDGYMIGTVCGRNLHHLMLAEPFSSTTALCGADLHDPSLRDELFGPTAICRKCVAILGANRKESAR